MTTLILNQIPRYPARISATNGIKVEIENAVDVVVKPSYGDLVPVPSVLDPSATYFMAWDKNIDYYSVISFPALVENIGDVIIGPNLASIGSLPTDADTGIYYTDPGIAATYTLSSFTRGISGSADAPAYRDALELGSAALNEASDFATALQGETADSAMQPIVYDPQGVGADAFAFESMTGEVSTNQIGDNVVTPGKLADGVLGFATRAAATAATINADIHSFTLNGDISEGDGLGGLFVDINNGNPNRLTSADSRTWYRVVSSNPKLYEFGAKGDGAANDTAAVLSASNSKLSVDDLGLTYLVTSLPTDFSKFRNAAFSFDGKLFRTDDYLDVTKYRVTKTLLYTDWTQDKACQFQGAWILPFQLAHGHTYDTTRIAWSWSFDKGQTWQEPEIILDKHPSSPTLGWNCFSAGIVGNRFVMFAEERQESNSALLRVIMRDILLDRTYYRANGIALTSGSSIATITLPNHGLIAGDQVSFSSVTGTDVAGLSGQKSVYAVLDKDRFQVDKGSVSASNQPNTGGANWVFGHTYYNNAFRETVLDNAMLQNGAGQMPTHIHSFTVKDAGNGEFFIGFHNGSSSPREVGVIHVQSFFGTPTFVKRRITAAFEASAAEPCIRYRSGRLHLTTRGQSASADGSSFGFSDNDGVSWTLYRFPGTLHYSPLPFEFYNGEAFIFGSERGENEWNAGSPDNRYNINRPRSFMLRIPYAELIAGNFAKLTTTLLGHEIYQGEQVSSGVGVGSTILDEDEGKLIYALSSEDFRSSTRYSLNLPSVDNEFLAQGYQPDIYAYEISLAKPRAGNIGYELRGPDLQAFPVYKQGNTRRVEGPLRFVGDVTIAASLSASKVVSGDTEIAVSERVCPTLISAAASLTLPAGYSVYKITPPASGAGAVNVTAIARSGTKEGDIITLVLASAGDAVIVNNTGFFRIGANRSLSTIAKILTLQRAQSSYWHLKSFADN